MTAYRPRSIGGSLQLTELRPSRLKKLDDAYPYYPVQVWRLGEQVLWTALGGEVVVDYSHRLKKELAGTAAVWPRPPRGFTPFTW